MRMLTRRSNGRNWGERGTSHHHGMSQLNPWMEVTRPPHAASVSLLDSSHMVMVDAWSDAAVQPVVDVGVRAAYITRDLNAPILLLLNLMLRRLKDEYHDPFRRLWLGLSPLARLTTPPLWPPNCPASHCWSSPMRHASSSCRCNATAPSCAVSVLPHQ